MSNVTQKDNPYTDDWGCLLETIIDGIVGTVTEPPLSEWEKLADYKFPNPEFCIGIGKVNWQAEKERIAHLKANGFLTMEGFRHGHTFLQLCDIRGYENTVIDMQDLVNGIDWIRDNLKDKVCIELDIDIQKVAPFGTLKDIDKLILDKVKHFQALKGDL